MYSEIDEPEENERKSFAERVAEEYSNEMWDPKEGEYRSFAEEVRHCLERDDVDGLYERMTEDLAFTGDKALKELAAHDLSSGNSDMAVFRITDREFFNLSMKSSLLRP